MKENSGMIMTVVFIGLPVLFGLIVLIREIQNRMDRRRFNKIKRE